MQDPEYGYDFTLDYGASHQWLHMSGRRYRSSHDIAYASAYAYAYDTAYQVFQGELYPLAYR